MNSSSTLDLLAFAPHPDDAELGCGGLLALAAKNGKKTAVVDLTRGELASQGTPEIREKEAAEAAQFLGLTARYNLSLLDGGISSHSAEQLNAVVACLRTHRPTLVLAPYWEGRHPDHAATGELVIKAAYFAALAKFHPELGARHQVVQLMHYAIRRTFQPSFITDVTAVYSQKQRAIAAYGSQINRASGHQASASDPGPLISSPLAVSSIEARDSFYGSQIGVQYGEAFILRNSLAINDPIGHFAANPVASALLFDRNW